MFLRQYKIPYCLQVLTLFFVLVALNGWTRIVLQVNISLFVKFKGEQADVKDLTTLFWDNIHGQMSGPHIFIKIFVNGNGCC